MTDIKLAASPPLDIIDFVVLTRTWLLYESKSPSELRLAEWPSVPAAKRHIRTKPFDGGWMAAVVDGVSGGLWVAGGLC